MSMVVLCNEYKNKSVWEYIIFVCRFVIKVNNINCYDCCRCYLSWSSELVEIMDWKRGRSCKNELENILV